MITLAIIALVIAALALCVVVFMLGMIQANFRELRALIPKAVAELAREEELADVKDQIVDSSPQHLRQKREERIRRGEDPEPAEGQIVRTRTPAQRQADADAAKEAKLDKWMPGVKRGK